MENKISFCIASAKDEKEYTKLLLKSLKDHTQISDHEILIFIDSDNQNTYEELVELQAQMPNMKICRNTNGFPVGSQRNVSIMFNAASNNVVCYLQSDMVVGKDFDKHILNNIDDNTVLACARIEPPLHPPSPEKIVKDFGITPETFDYSAFNTFVDTLQSENRPNMFGHFAPFAVYKSAWFDKLGGFDTQFRCSREDSDTIIRMTLCGLNMIQSWNACVYHFTCVSSRGKDWYKTDEGAKYKNELQQLADIQELKRFLRKWGYFGHNPQPVYDISFVVEVDRYVDMNLLKYIEPYCTRMYITDAYIANQLASQLEFDAHYYSNLRWNYTPDYWNAVKHLFNPTNFSERIRSDEVQGDVIVRMKYSTLLANFSDDVRSVIENIHKVVNTNDIGLFEYGPLTIEITNKRDVSGTMARTNNLDALITKQFKFQ
jgi:GT2 family glycosyltransferase